MDLRTNALVTIPASSVVSHALLGRLLEKKIHSLSKPDFASLDPKGLLDIPWKDVVCLKDSANVSKADPIEIGQLAHSALTRLYAEFGVTGMPQTWGELMGSVAYCSSLSAICNFPRINAKEDALWFDSCMQVTREYSPELVEVSLAYHEGRKEDLVRIFQDTLGFQKCSYHFNPFVGWDSFPEA